MYVCIFFLNSRWFLFLQPRRYLLRYQASQSELGQKQILIFSLTYSSTGLFIFINSITNYPIIQAKNTGIILESSVSLIPNLLLTLPWLPCQQVLLTFPLNPAHSVRTASCPWSKPPSSLAGFLLLLLPSPPASTLAPQLTLLCFIKYSAQVARVIFLKHTLCHVNFLL